MFISEIDNHEKSKYARAANGDAIVPIYHMLVYTDFNKNDPGISKIIYFDTDDYTDIDSASSTIYDAEKGVITHEQARRIIEGIFGPWFIREYTADMFGQAQRYDRQYERGKSRSDAYHAEQQQRRAGFHFEIGEDVVERYSRKGSLFS